MNVGIITSSPSAMTAFVFSVTCTLGLDTVLASLAVSRACIRKSRLTLSLITLNPSRPPGTAASPCTSGRFTAKLSSTVPRPPNTLPDVREWLAAQFMPSALELPFDTSTMRASTTTCLGSASSEPIRAAARSMPMVMSLTTRAFALGAAITEPRLVKTPETVLRMFDPFTSMNLSLNSRTFRSRSLSSTSPAGSTIMSPSRAVAKTRRT